MEADVTVWSAKAIIGGKVIELYEFNRPQVRVIARGGNGRGRAVEAKTKEDKRNNREVDLFRAKRRVRRSINANVGRWGDVTGKFLTLTFKEDVRDVTTANYEFKLFIDRINYRYNLQLKYVAVIEFQDKNREGVVHYHIVIFNMPYIDVNEIREKVWKNGFVKLNKIDGIHNLGSYVTKYMVKSLDDSRLVGRKCFFTSRGLYKERVHYYRDEEAVIRDIDTKRLNHELEIVWSTHYENEYQGKVNYSMLVPMERESWLKRKLTPDEVLWLEKGWECRPASV